MAKLRRLKFNDPAPDVDVLASTGESIRLSSLWQRGMLLLAFTRHFGCPQCKDMLDRLSQYRPALEKTGMLLAAVTQADPAQTAEFCATYAPGLICLSDPERKVYSAYGLGRGALNQTLLSLQVLRANGQVRQRKGWAPLTPPRGQDAWIMPGLFIIGRDGLVRLPYYYDHIADHPSFDLLVHGILGSNWNSPLDRPILPDEEHPAS